MENNIADNNPKLGNSEMPRNSKNPHFLALIVIAVAALGAWITFDYFYYHGNSQANLQIGQASKQTETQAPLQVPTSQQLQQQLSAQSSSTLSSFQQPPAHLHIGNTMISLEYATTTAEEQQGLSDRTSLGAEEGMWFVVNPPIAQGMWMKDMNFSLDMIWFDQNLKVIYIARNVTPQSYPEVFAPPTASAYVLEVNAGFADLHGVQMGDTVSLSQ